MSSRSKKDANRLKSIRQVGEALLDLEVILMELANNHGLQHGDILALTHVYLTVHLPDAREVYTADGSSPEFYYGYPRGSHD